MNKFKVGDIVRCLRGTIYNRTLQLNSIHIVSIADKYGAVGLDGADDVQWLDVRFELIGSDLTDLERELI